jgi:uncharacterized membrane protein
MQFARCGTHQQQSHTRLQSLADTLGFTGQMKPNVGTTERIVSGLAGGGLLLTGLKHRGVSGLIMALLGAELVRRAATGRCPLYEQIGVDTAAPKPSRAEDFRRRGIHVEESITINRPRDEVYRFWRNFENLPRFMNHLEKVEVTGERTSRWTAKSPTGHVQWNAEIINEEPGSLIAWRSLLGADVDNRGTVRFRDAPQGRGCEIRVVLDYIPPAGRLGAALARLFGENPEQQIRDDLRRLREILETGEIATIEGQPSGRRLGGTARDIGEPRSWTRPIGMSDVMDNERPVYTASGHDDPGLKGGMTQAPAAEPLIRRDQPGAAGGTP